MWLTATCIYNIPYNTLHDVQGTIQALHLLKNERDRRERSHILEERRRAVLEGKNPDEVLLRKKREKEFSKRKAEFEENRRQKHVEIVSKLLKEETQKRKNERLASKLHWQGRWSMEGDRQTRRRREVCEMTHKFERGEKFFEGERGTPVISGNDEIGGERCSDEGGSDSGDGESSASGDGGASGDSGGERVRDVIELDEMLAKPEINGLWAQKESKTRGPDEGGSEEGERREGGKTRSKLEQKILRDVVDNLKQSVVKKQVAAGKEFKVSYIHFLSC